jgi:carbamoyl-phosphate synthase large subunit
MPAENGHHPHRVLVTGMGGPSGVAFAKALAGLEVEILAADIDPYAAGLYLVPDDRRFIVPRGDAEGFVAAILALCEREQVDVLVPTVDTELLPLAEARDELEGRNIRPVLASERTLRDCLDKWRLHEVCLGATRVPGTELVDESYEPARLPPPVIVKPRSGSGSRGIRLITGNGDLMRLPRDGTLLVQELLPGAEYSLDVLAGADGVVRAVVPRERLKVDSGIAVTGRVLRDERLEAIGREVAETIGLTTVANVQVKLATDGEPALLEVNPRFPGTMSLTVASGINMPALAVGEALGAPLPAGPLPFDEVAMVRFLEERFFDFEEIAALQRQAEPLHA